MAARREVDTEEQRTEPERDEAGEPQEAVAREQQPCQPEAGERSADVRQTGHSGCGVETFPARSSAATLIRLIRWTPKLDSSIRSTPVSGRRNVRSTRLVPTNSAARAGSLTRYRIVRVPPFRDGRPTTRITGGVVSTRIEFGSRRVRSASSSSTRGL